MAGVSLNIVDKYRCQQTVEVNEEDSHAFLSSAKEVLANQQSDVLKSIVLNEDNKAFIHSIAWDLLTTIGSHLVDHSDEADTNVDCIFIIERIVEVGKAKEIFIGLLEQLDQFLDSAVARLFFRPLQTVLTKFGSSKDLYMEQALEQLHACMESIPLPQYDGLDRKQKRLLIQDEEYQQLEETCVDLVEFVSPFVFEVRDAVAKMEEDDLTSRKKFRSTLKIRDEIQRFLLRLMEYPLVFVEVDFLILQQEVDKIPEGEKTSYESGFCTCMKQILSYLADMRVSFSSLFSYKSNSQQEYEEVGSLEAEEDQCQLSILGISNLAYITQSVGLADARVPLSTALHKIHIATLLKKTEEPALFKGLELLHTLVDQIDSLTICSNLLQDDIYMKLPETLINIMVRHTSEALRQKSVRILPVYMDKFDWKGRYRLVTVLLKSAEHSGVKGFLIGRIKDYVHLTLQQNVNNEWFVGSHLRQILPSIFHLPNGSQTDLLEESDKIIAALNFLRYLLLRDSKKSDLTGVWSMLELIDKGYLSELITGLELSKMHYKQREEELVDEKKRARRAKDADNVSVSVGGQEISKMPFEQQMQVLTSAQFTFDLMQSLLGRVNEIISAQSTR
ncbi:putative glomulin [Apostichopus japonicus]|uniref:Putative glomulin n=1 Tax=Stichopus japonicus TaxID=307972 RepID=A0A2G8KFS9_STIJA|nr:putative glomulin [Apostichopus japonicus]